MNQAYSARSATLKLFFHDFSSLGFELITYTHGRLRDNPP